jgi:hypothetical protein
MIDIGEMAWLGLGHGIRLYDIIGWKTWRLGLGMGLGCMGMGMGMGMDMMMITE